MQLFVYAGSGFEGVRVCRVGSSWLRVYGLGFRLSLCGLGFSLLQSVVFAASRFSRCVLRERQGESVLRERQGESGRSSCERKRERNHARERFSKFHGSPSSQI